MNSGAKKTLSFLLAGIFYVIVLWGLLYVASQTYRKEVKELLFMQFPKGG